MQDKMFQLTDNLIPAIQRLLPPVVTAFFCSPIRAGRWIKLVLFCFAGILVAGALLTITIDPCMRYAHRLGPTLYIMDYETIPGMLRHEQYDSLIIGSSTSQNFNLKEFRDQLKLSPVKATASGCFWATGKVFLDMALEARRDSLKAVIQSLEIPAYFNPADQHKTELPGFLYDPPGFPDCRYWWNFDIWNEYCKNLRRIFLKSKSSWADYQNRDLMYAGDYRADLMKFGAARLKREFNRNHFRPKPFQPEKIQNFETSFRKNILDSVSRHPEIRFLFYFPPYSIFYLAESLQTGQLIPALETREKIAEKLLAFPNVELFDFQADFDVITNPDRYKDLIHFVPPVNDQMVRKMAAGESRIRTVEMVRENNRKILEQLEKNPPVL